MRLAGKVAVITGASRGIGRTLALAFAREGADLVLAARTAEALAELAAEVEALGRRALAVPTDVTDEAQVKALFQATAETFDGLDVLVNNAGAGAFRPIHGTPLRTWEWLMAVNATSTFLCTKHAWRLLQRRGGGSIINIASLAGTRAYPMYAAYSASKWAQIGLTKAAAEEGKPYRIRVNAIAPGKVDTPMRANIAEDKEHMLKAEDLIGVAVFLASDESRFITGQVIETEWFGPLPEVSDEGN